MRLIDADAFKKYITDGIDGLILPKDQAVKVIAITKSFLKDIDEQPTVESPGWIPVENRLPEESGQYYVSGGGKVWICNFFILPNFTGGWCNDVSNPVVQAWMPIPKPYEKEVNDNGR